jgi:hypothetical protein
VDVHALDQREPPRRRRDRLHAVVGWGDYAAAVIDPTDGCFWLAHEFVFDSVSGDSEWGTHVANVCTSPALVPALGVWGGGLLALVVLATGWLQLRRHPLTSNRGA